MYICAHKNCSYPYPIFLLVCKCFLYILRIKDHFYNTLYKSFKIFYGFKYIHDDFCHIECVDVLLMYMVQHK